MGFVKDGVRRLYRWSEVVRATSRPLWWVRQRGSAVARWAYPSDFWYGKYPHTFLERHPPANTGGASELPNVIWALWTGQNPLTPNREAALKSMRDMNPETPVELVTRERLDDIVVSDHPLHPAYDNLSSIHRADYLRAYLLHHYGGGYSDIKPLRGAWMPSFDRLRSSDSWALGGHVVPPAWPGDVPGRLGTHLHRYQSSLLSNSTLIARSHTAFSAEWLREVERRLDYYAPALAENPGGVWGSDAAYPIGWTRLLADIQHPLCLKYQARLIIDDSINWDARHEYR